MSRDEIKERLASQIESTVEAVCDELFDALAAEVDETDEEHEDEMLDVASERDHLAAELEIAQEKIKQLELQLELAERELAHANEALRDGVRVLPVRKTEPELKPATQRALPL